HFIKQDGTIIHGEFFTHLFYLIDWIKKFRIIQEDLFKIKILAVLSGEINKYDKRKIENKIKLLMGDNCKIEWTFVEDINYTKNGKYLYTKSLIRI
ncbi:MAG: phenylacetate--CoA ligase family protein, partial [Candidatus Thermoplasmatota archaeon]|nr:phenylacetate--CoA ligase family protein [Candidatus Thermoplasmatota archaeon]